MKDANDFLVQKGAYALKTHLRSFVTNRNEDSFKPWKTKASASRYTPEKSQMKVYDRYSGEPIQENVYYVFPEEYEKAFNRELSTVRGMFSDLDAGEPVSSEAPVQENSPVITRPDGTDHLPLTGHVVTPNTDEIALDRWIGEEKKKIALIDHYTEDDLPQFLRDIQDKSKFKRIPTGYDDLDSLLLGGLPPRLVFVAGTPGQGKTTWALQMADYMAEHENDVLYFALEMSKNDLIAKSLSRSMYQTAKKNHLSVKQFAKTADEIIDPDLNERWAKEVKDLFQDCYTDYAMTIGKHLKILALREPSIDEIYNSVDYHVNILNRPVPVVIVDYCQIVGADEEDEKDTRRLITKIVKAMKRINEDFNTPVIGISSVNRASYYEPIELNSFQESNAFDFYGEIMIGLQPAGYEYAPEDTSTVKRRIRIDGIRALNNELKAKGMPVWSELKILKSRTGVNEIIPLDFNGKYSLYTRGDQALRESKQLESKEGKSKKKKLSDLDKMNQ